MPRVPYSRPNDRVEKGEQPYKDDRETLAEKEAKLQAQAEEYGELYQRESGDEQRERMEHEAEKRFEEAQKHRT